MESLNSLTGHFAAMEQWTQATLVARLKREQSNLRRSLMRIHTIRETSFISSGYLLSDLFTILLFLIRGLDNPFGYYERSSSEDVSLNPLKPDYLI